MKNFLLFLACFCIAGYMAGGQTISVTSPNGGESWAGCSSRNITWTHSGTTGYFDVKYSLDNGGNWASLATNYQQATSPGTFNWTVPNVNTTQALVRVEQNGNPSVNDISNATFTITPALQVTSPNGGESWQVGAGTHNITWTSSGVSNYYNIDYSVNGGSSWINIITNSLITINSYTWTIPNNPSTQCLVRVQDYQSSTCKTDNSDALFTIAPPTPVITVTAPNGGNTLYIGQGYTITWTSAYLSGSFVKIEYSSNNGSSWNTVTASTNNTGSYSWTNIPNTPSNQCLVKISDAGAPATYDVSDAVFSIALGTITVTSPNGGESWIACSNQTVAWTRTGTSNYFNVYYSINGGTTWQSLATNYYQTGVNCSFSWTLNNTATSQARVLVTDYNNSAIRDSSDADFTIVPAVTVTAPNGSESWQGGTTHTITWTQAAGASNWWTIQYSTNAGSSWNTIVSNTYITTGSYNWPVPNNPSTQCLVRVYDYNNSCKTDNSDNLFTITPATPVITVTSPNGGNTYYVGGSYNITWTYQYVVGTFVAIEYSTNNGSTWNTIINSTAISAGSYTWNPVPNTPSGQCLVRVSEFGNPTVNDVSNGVFSIVYPYVIITAPNGGESWNGCSSQNITWTYYGTGSPSWQVQYSLNNGSTWNTLTSGTSGSSYSWNPVVDTSSTNALVRVTRTTDTLVRDVSNAVFTINADNSIIISSPNGSESWQCNNPAVRNIAWSASGTSYYYNLYYSTNGGSSWTSIATYYYSTSANPTYNWTVPNAPSTNCLIRIEDSYNTCKNDKSDAVFTIVAPNPVITVTAPNGGNTFYVGSSYNITWTYQYVASNFVTIEYSINNGATWTTIINSTSISAGSYTWNPVPNTPGNQCLVKVSEYLNPSVKDSSNAVFTIVYPYVTVTAPNTGVTWNGCTSQNITWSYYGTGSPNWNIQYSTNNGATWTTIANTTGSSYNWNPVPNTITTSQALIRVTNNADTLVRDKSDVNFSIVPITYIIINSPNGGENWEVNNPATRAIQWSYSGTTNYFNLYYSINGGSSWNTITTYYYAGSSGNGSYTWTIPNNPSTNCLVKVEDYYSTCKFDNSNAVFTIQPPTPVITVASPNGGNTYYVGSSYNITWGYQYVTGNFVQIDYSTNNGASWLPVIASTSISTGSYSWNPVPNTPSTQCLMRIRSTSDTTITDNSNAVFSIVYPYVVVNSPNGSESWNGCSSQTISWSGYGAGSGPWKVEYSLNNGSTWATLTASTTSSSYTWNPVIDTGVTQALVRVTRTSDALVTDASNAVFTINGDNSIIVTSPNGGESWQCNNPATRIISWSASGTSYYYNLYYSTNGGSSWNTITTYYYTTSSNPTYNWTIPNAPSVNCLIKIEDSYNTCKNDKSNSVFTIVAPTPVITVTSPNGGNTYYVGGSYNITWTYQYVAGSFVTIDYSTNNGSSWTSVTSSTAISTGSYTWTPVPNTPSTQCLIRISELGNPTVNDVSNAVFSIVYPYVIVNSPNGSESWNGCSSQTISWTGYGAGTGPWKVEYTIDNGANWTTLTSSTTSSSYTWNPVPNTPTTNALVRVTRTSDALVTDASNAVFNITQNTAIIIASPNGGESWQVNNPATRNISWTASGTSNYYDLYYSTNGGSTWIAIVIDYYSASANPSYTWTVPNAPSTQCLILIQDNNNTCKFDKSNAVFTIVAPTPVITVTSPNGGNNFYVGSSYNITWTYQYVQSNFVTLEYSTNGGATWSTIINSTAIGSSYSWTVPNTPSNQCLVRVSEYGNPSVFDVSNAVFNIIYPYITVSSPNGGETWNGCTSQTISWTGYGTSGPYMVEYSTDNGVNWTTLVSSTGSTSYNWNPVPNAQYNTSLVRVSVVNNSAIYDVSNSTFTIAQQTYIIVNIPNGGESWQVNNPASQIINWAFAGTNNYFDIYVSYNGGTSWTLIGNDIYATGGNYSWSWTVANNPSTNCLIRVVDYLSSCKTDESNSPFTIVAPVPYINVTVPNGGNTLYSYNNQTITWTSGYLASSNVKIDYSVDSGATWISVTASTSNTGSYSWTVPVANSTKCLVKISDLGNSATFDISDAVFTIKPAVVVTAPNGGENVSGCTVTTINWTGESSSGNYQLQYSLNGGTSWTTIVSQAFSGGPNFSYNWTLPNSPSGFCLVKVTNTGNTNKVDQSNNVFSILPTITVTNPNNGGSFAQGSTLNITWTEQGVSDFYNIDYSTTGTGGPWTNIVFNTFITTNTYAWTVPVVTSSNCYIKITDYQASCKTDMSDLAFSISASPAAVTVTSPNGGEPWVVCTAHNITWSENATSDIFIIEYSSNNGSSWTPLDSGYITNSGTYAWTLPSSATAQGLIRVTDSSNVALTDASNAVFSILNLATPGAISGSTTVCQNSTQTYSIALVNGATSYTWTLPGGWTGSSTSNTITAVAGSSGGTISVVANNSCSSSSASNLNISVTALPSAAGAITGNTSPCSGVSQVYSISAVSGASSYTWLLPTGYSGTSSTTNINVLIGSGTGDIQVYANNSCGSGAPSALTITPNGTSLPNQPGNISGLTSPCSSSSQTYSVVAVPGATSYTWSLPGTWTGTSTTNSINATVGSSNGTISVTANNSCGSSSAQSLSVTVSTVPSQPGAITGSNSVCQNTTNTYSISSVSGATNYTWTLPGGWTGSSTSTSIVAVAAGGSGNVSVTANNSCGASTARTLAVTVNTPVTPSVSVTSSPTGTLCFNTNITFTATPVNGGTPPTYQWYKNGVAVGLNAVTYSNASWANNDSVWVVMTTSLTCVTANAASSNKTYLTITSNTPSITVFADATSICAGTTVNFTSNITNGGSSPSYQWKKNGSNISGATSSSYSTSAINNTDVFSCVLTSNIECATSPTATSNTILITVTQYVNPFVSITASSNPVCTGQNVTFTATPTNGGPSPAYQWRKNGNNISGETSSSYSSSSMVNNDTVDVVMTSGLSCLNAPSDTSNRIIISVPPTLTPSVSISVSPNDTVCSGTSVTFTATPVNGGSPPSYQWKKNGINIPGETAATYTATTLVNSDAISVVMTSSEPCPSPPAAASNSIAMGIIPNLTASVSASGNPSSPVCTGTNVTFTATPVNGGATPAYQWKINGVDVGGETNSTFTTSTLANGDAVSVAMATSSVCTTPASANSNILTYTVNSLPPVPTISPSGPTTFCAGGSVNLTSSSSSGNTWSNGAITQTITVSSADTFFVTVTDGNNCSSVSSSLIVNVNQNPAVSLSYTDVSCNGDSNGTATASASGGSSPYFYEWNNGRNVSSISGLQPAIYTVTVTDANLCSATGSVTIGTITSIVIADTLEYCKTQSSFALLSGSPAGGIWTGSSGVVINGNDTLDLVSTPWTTGTPPHTLFYSKSGCTDSLVLIINGADAGSDMDFCVNDGIFNLPAPSPAGGTWSSVGIGGIIDANAGQINPAGLNGAVQYIYTHTGCPDTMTVTYREIVLTAATINEGCSPGNDGTATVSAAGGITPYTYLWSDSQTNSSATGLAAGNYFVTVTDAGNCAEETAATIVKDAMPVVNVAQPSVSVCAGDSTGISASGAVTYSWLPATGLNNANISNPSASPDSTTIYFVTGTTSGCSDVDSVFVTVNQLPSAPAISASGPTDICAGDNVTLTSSSSLGNLWSDGSTTTSILVSTSGTYYVNFTDSNGCTSLNSSSVIVNVTPVPVITAGGSPVFCEGGNVTLTSSATTGNTWSTGETTQSITVDSAGDYTVTVNNGSCSLTSAITTVTVNPLPVPVITPAGPATFCDGGSVLLTASPSASYNWSPNNEITQTITASASGNYSVTETDGNGCVGTSAVTVVTVNPLPATPVITPGGPTSFCFGENVTLTSNSAVNNTWSPGGETTQSIIVSTSGSYSVTVADSNGCSSTSSAVNVTVNSLPAADAGSDVIINSGNSTALNGSGGTTCNWSPSGSLDDANICNPSATPSSTTVYFLTVTDLNGCTGVDSVTVTVISTPPPVGDFTATSVNITEGGSTDFVDLSTNNPTSWQWTFAGGTPSSSTAQNPTGIVYSNAGCYDVTLIVSNAGGSDTITKICYIQVDSAVSYVCGPNIDGCPGATNTVIVGTGTSALSNQTYPAPYGNWYYGARHQMLYRASELQAMGFTGGIISSAAFNVQSVSGTSTYSNFEIKMGCTGLTSLATFQSGLTTVFPAQVVNLTTGWNTHNFSTSYEWDGVSNIIVEVCFNHTSYTYNSPTYYTATGFNSVIYYRADASGVCTNNTVTIATERPNIRFVTCGVQTCPAITVSTSSTNPTCGNSTDGTALAAATGGIAPYSYSWSGGQTTANASGLSAGTYAVTATDNNGCAGIGIVSLTAPPAIVSSVSSVNSVCGSSNGSATLSASGGTGALTYIWSNGQTSAIATGLGAGNYTVTISDANGCSKTDGATISDSAPVVSASATTVSCYGGGDGSASLSVNGGSTPYTYLWSTGATSTSLSGLSAGTYTVTVNDNNGCTATASATVNQPAVLTASVNATNVLCYGGSTGTATATATGGTAPYTYLWSNSATSSAISGLPAGNYSVTATDSKGCQATATASVTQPAAALTATIISSVNTSCSGASDGSATAGTSGGTPSYSLLWSNGQTSPIATGLAAGSYTVTATDASGCSATAGATITQPAAIGLTTSATLANCNSSDGSASVTASGGTGAFTYSWSNGQTNSTVTGLVKGNYSVTVTDANGCSGNSSVYVGEVGNLSVSISSFSDVNCFGGADGSATALGSAGTSPYTFNWSNGANGQTVNNFSAGNYTVTITDNAGCTSTAGVSISQPSAAVSVNISSLTNVRCLGGNDGAAAATAAGGIGSYSYLWSTAATTSAVTGLGAGTYTITVSDINSCTATAIAIITQPSSSVSANISSATGVSCFGGNNGSATVFASGGVSPYTYLWSNGASVSSNSNLAAGTYTVTVNDNNSCTATAIATITQPAAGVSVNISSSANVSCFGGNNGSATATATGGIGSYTYLWSTAGTSPALSGLTAGNYTVTVTDANGCTASSFVTITQPAALAVNGASTAVSCFGGATGTATVSASGGTPTYSYFWSTGGTATTISGLSAGTYTVTVTDANNCTATASATVTSPASAVSVSISSLTNVSCFGLCNGSATPAGSGGTAPYSYTWSSGNGTNLCAGNYTVTVTDNKGCTASTGVTITQPASAVSAAISSKTDVSCYGASTGSASVSASGGTSPYSYSWSSGASGTTASGLNAAAHTVTVTDSKGCTAATSVTISQPTAITTATGSTPATCGNSNGSASVTPGGGVSPYTYSWSTGGNSQTISNLAAGAYNFTVTDANGCTKTGSVTVASQSSPTVTITATNIGCFGNSDGMATASVSGGTAPFTFLWSNGATTATVTGLSAGNHSVVVTDANNCTGNQSVTITQPQPLVVSLTSTNDTIGAPNCNGTATAAVTGGTLPYSYFWSNGQTGATATALCANTYSVTITDVNFCTQQSQVTVISVIGIDERNPEMGVNIYPNPNNGRFVLVTTPTKYEPSLPAGRFVRKYEVRIINVLGQEVLKDEIIGPSVEIDLTGHARGMYMYQVFADDQPIANGKIVIE